MRATREFYVRRGIDHLEYSTKLPLRGDLSRDDTQPRQTASIPVGVMQCSVFGEVAGEVAQFKVDLFDGGAGNVLGYRVSTFSITYSYCCYGIVHSLNSRSLSVSGTLPNIEYLCRKSSDMQDFRFREAGTHN